MKFATGSSASGGGERMSHSRSTSPLNLFSSIPRLRARGVTGGGSHEEPRQLPERGAT
jgi:hypothetical protein